MNLHINTTSYIVGNTSGRYRLGKRNQIQNNPLKTETAIWFSAPPKTQKDIHNQDNVYMNLEDQPFSSEGTQWATGKEQKANMSNIAVYNVD